MTRHRVAELTGALLDAAVALAEGYRVVPAPCDPQGCWVDDGGCNPWPYRPSTDRALAMSILWEDQIFLDPPRSVHASMVKADGTPKGGIWRSYENWQATVSARTRTIPNPHDPELPRIVGRGEGPDPLIAICRAKVASHFGEFVELPDA
jgi:hypothetical protein